MHTKIDDHSIKINRWGIIHENKYSTRSGDRVRSRGEVEIANFLYSQGIQFKYERNILLGHYRVRPDFYLPEYDIYIEYFGMDDPEYQRKAFYKKGVYNRNGFRLISLYFKSKGCLGAVIKHQFEKITKKPFPQKQYFNWRIYKKPAMRFVKI